VLQPWDLLLVRGQATVHLDRVTVGDVVVEVAARALIEAEAEDTNVRPIAVVDAQVEAAEPVAL
jgi:hypothetical protein